MRTAKIDDFLIANAPTQPQPTPPVLLRARASMRAALHELREIPDSALEKPWHWRGNELDVRYGFFDAFQALDAAKPQLGADSVARSLLGAATATRWDLYGLLAGLDDADLDRDPGNGEWTIRRTLGHIVGGQRAYAWGTAWWFARRDASADDFPARVPQEIVDRLPQEESEAEGSIDEIAASLDDILDLSAATFVGIDDSGLAARARWAGLPVDVRFRLVRWSSHMREHIIQIEKTLGYIGRPTTEVGYLLRLISSAYGRIEEALFMRPGADAELASLERVTRELAAAARDVRSAAEA